MDNSKIIDSIHILNEKNSKISDSIHTKFSFFKKNNNILFSKLKHLAVCTGPGSYTSLRVGISFMFGLSFAKNIPLYGITGIELLSSSNFKKRF